MEEDLGGEISESSSDQSLFRPSKVPRSGDPAYLSDSSEEEYDVRMRLIEVFSVQFLDYRQVSLAQPYGVIFLNCGRWPHLLFERAPGDPLPIDDNGFFQLTDPTRARTAFDSNGFHAFLFSLDGNVEEIRQKIWRSYPGDYRSLCNKLLTRTFATAFGPIELNYAVLTGSVTATLEVKLMDWKHGGISTGSGPFEIAVFGSVTAGILMIPDEKAKVSMFKRDKDACALVKPGEAIPLSRCMTVCPLRSSVVFDVSLYHPSHNESGDDAHLIVNRVIQIPATEEELVVTLENDCACLQLKVTCTNWLGLCQYPVWLTKELD